MAAKMKKCVLGLMMTFTAIQKMTAHRVPLAWTPELQEKLEKMKEALKQAVKLSQLDISKKLYACTNATVTKGMCYILVQRKGVQYSFVTARHSRKERWVMHLLKLS